MLHRSFIYFLILWLQWTQWDDSAYAARGPASVQRPRPAAISTKLARARFRAGGGQARKGVPFRVWKRGREAQHLIPYAIGASLGIRDSFMNSARNGMMLPSGRPTAAAMPNPALAKGKLTHIKRGLAHPAYNRFVGRVMTKAMRTGPLNQRKLERIADYLRGLHRQNRPAAAQYVDDLDSIRDSAIPRF